MRATHLAVERHVLVRLSRIHEAIASGQCPSLKRLVELTEVSQRTVERDIETLRDAFAAPVEYDRARGGYRYADPTFALSLPPIRLTEGQLVAILLAYKVLSEFKGTPFEADLREVLPKLAALMPAEISVRPDWLDSLISFDIRGPRGEIPSVSRNLAAISRAINRNETVQIAYYSATQDRESTRCVDFYHVRYTQGAWYAVGFCHQRSAVRTFAVDRIRSIKEAGRRFVRDSGFSVRDYFGEPWGLERGERFRAVVKFDPYQARWIRERQWHPSQVLTECQDGSLVMRVEIAGWGEFKRWVMSYGAHAVLLEPEQMREEIRQELASLLETYK